MCSFYAGCPIQPEATATSAVQPAKQVDATGQPVAASEKFTKILLQNSKCTFEDRKLEGPDIQQKDGELESEYFHRIISSYQILFAQGGAKILEKYGDPKNLLEMTKYEIRSQILDHQAAERQSDH